MAQWTDPEGFDPAVGDPFPVAKYKTYVRENLVNLRAAPSATPPASPTLGDRWVFPTGGANGQHWEFIYRPDLDATYPWQYLGGGELVSSGTVVLGSGVATAFYDFSGAIAVPRAGVYVADGSSWGSGSGGGGTIVQLAMGASAFTQTSIGNAGNFGHKGFATLAAAASVRLQGQGVNGFSYSYQGQWGVRPIKVA